MKIYSPDGLMRYNNSNAIVDDMPLRSQCIIKSRFRRTGFSGAGDRGRTGTVSLPPDFESGTSANSITPAFLLKFSRILRNVRQARSRRTPVRHRPSLSSFLVYETNFCAQAILGILYSFQLDVCKYACALLALLHLVCK